MSDHKRYDEIQRGDLAKALLESPLLQEALGEIEKSILMAWEQTSPRDTEAREKAWAFYLASKKFKATLVNYIETGRMANLQLQEKKRLSLFRSN
jgi:hypothetical protein